MSELADVFDAIKSREAVRGVARAEQRARNRAAFPGFTAAKDVLESVFGPCKAIWAEENGKTIGRKDGQTQ